MSNITYRAKILAERLGITPDAVAGSNGTVTVNNIRDFLAGRNTGESSAKAPAYDSTKPDQIRKMSAMEKTIFKSMYNSLAGTAQATYDYEVEISDLVTLYKSLKPKYTKAGIKLSYTTMLIKAVAMSLEENPDVMAQYVDEDTLRIPSNIDIGCAVDVPGGLVVPVIRNANLKDLRTICLELEDISTRARSNKLTADDFGGACMTVTNLGMFGATYLTPVLNNPESMILGTGSIVKSLGGKDGNIVPISTMKLSLTVDRRILAPSKFAPFMNGVIEGLKNFRWI